MSIDVHTTAPSASESDTNTGSGRRRWSDARTAADRSLLDRDAGVYLHQSVSTPCLTGIVGAEGVHLIAGDGRRYLDFHGNSAHQIGYGHPRLVGGDARLGELNGVFSAPITAATALAPVAGATLAAGVASYPAAAAVFAGVALLGAGCALLADRRVPRVRKPLRAEAERGQS